MCQIASHLIVLDTHNKPTINRQLDVWQTLVLSWVGLQRDGPLDTLLVANVCLALGGNLQ